MNQRSIVSKYDKIFYKLYLLYFLIVIDHDKIFYGRVKYYIFNYYF